MSLSKFLCKNRGEIYTIFRRLRGWKVEPKDYSLIAKKDGLSINIILIGTPTVVYEYGDSSITVLVDKDNEEKIISYTGDVREIQNKIKELINQ